MPIGACWIRLHLLVLLGSPQAGPGTVIACSCWWRLLLLLLLRRRLGLLGRLGRAGGRCSSPGSIGHCPAGSGWEAAAGCFSCC
jgi:hypothetical protein